MAKNSRSDPAIPLPTTAHVGSGFSTQWAGLRNVYIGPDRLASFMLDVHRGGGVRF